jgi:hypothetical protein
MSANSSAQFTGNDQLYFVSSNSSILKLGANTFTLRLATTYSANATTNTQHSSLVSVPNTQLILSFSETGASNTSIPREIYSAPVVSLGNSVITSEISNTTLEASQHEANNYGQLFANVETDNSYVLVNFRIATLDRDANIDREKQVWIG